MTLWDLVEYPPLEARMRCSFEWFESGDAKGKKRVFGNPSKGMRELHREIIARLEKSSIGRVDYSFAYGIYNKSAIDNALIHIGSRYFYKFDIANAYPSVPLGRLAEVLNRVDPGLGTVGAIHHFLMAFCAGRDGGLAVGGPASPALFNFYCAVEIDRNVKGICHESYMRISRYYDDMTISSPHYIPRILRKRVRQVVNNAGFEIKHPKSEVCDLEEQPITITGVTMVKGWQVRPKEAYVHKVMKYLRKPASIMTSYDALVFAGLTAHLLLFSQEKHRVLCEVPYSIPSDVLALQSRCLERVRFLRRRKVLKRSRGRRRTFSLEFLDRVRAQVPIVEFVGAYVRLKKRGKEFVGLSPFNNEKTPSFYVSPEKRRWFDFSGGRSGDVFEFLMLLRDGVKFPEAVREVCAAYGIEVPERPDDE